MDEILDIDVYEMDEERIKTIIVKYLKDNKKYNKKMDILDPKAEDLLKRKISLVKEKLEEVKRKNLPYKISSQLLYIFGVILIGYVLVSFFIINNSILLAFSLLALVAGSFVALEKNYNSKNVALQNLLENQIKKLDFIKSNMDKQIDLSLSTIFGDEEKDKEIEKDTSYDLKVSDLRIFESLKYIIDDSTSMIKNSPLAGKFFKIDDRIRSSLNIEANPSYQAYKLQQKRPGYNRKTEILTDGDIEEIIRRGK